MNMKKPLPGAAPPIMLSFICFENCGNYVDLLDNCATTPKFCRVVVNLNFGFFKPVDPRQSPIFQLIRAALYFIHSCYAAADSVL